MANHIPLQGLELGSKTKPLKECGLGMIKGLEGLECRPKPRMFDPKQKGTKGATGAFKPCKTLTASCTSSTKLRQLGAQIFGFLSASISVAWLARSAARASDTGWWLG